MKPDLGIYEKNCGRQDVIDFAALDHHMEFEFHPGDDPFRDINASFTYQDGKFEYDTHASSDSLGQITSYVSAQAAIQFRTHIFSVVICHSLARLLRWDRSGAVVSRSFSYSKLPYLAEEHLVTQDPYMNHSWPTYSLVPSDSPTLNHGVFRPLCRPGIYRYDLSSGYLSPKLSLSFL